MNTADLLRLPESPEGWATTERMVQPSFHADFSIFRRKSLEADFGASTIVLL